MTTQLSPHDWEQLSAYMDGRLSVRETQEIGQRLDDSKELRMALEQLRQVRTILKAVPLRKVRRHFTLTPDMVKPAKLLQLVPIFRFASAAASLALVVLFILNFLPNLARMSFGASAPMASVQQEAAADRAAEEAAPQIIFWGSPTPELEMMGKGGGAPPAPWETIPQAAMPVEEPAVEMAPLPSATPQPAATMEAEVFASSDTSSGPILGIPPSEEQGTIMTPLKEEISPIRESRFDTMLILYIGLAVVALGGIIASAVIRRKY